MFAPDLEVNIVCVKNITPVNMNAIYRDFRLADLRASFPNRIMERPSACETTRAFMKMLPFRSFNERVRPK